MEKDFLPGPVVTGRTRGNSFKLKEGRMKLDIRKTVVRLWNMLSREVVDAPSFGVQGQVG